MPNVRRIVWLHDPATPIASVRPYWDSLRAAGHFVVPAVAPVTPRVRQTRWTPAPDGGSSVLVSPPHREQDARLDDAERARVLAVRLLREGQGAQAVRLATRAATSPVSETMRAGLRGLRPDLLVVSSWPRAAAPAVEWIRAAQAIGCPVACVATGVDDEAWPWSDPTSVIAVSAAVGAQVRASGYAGAVHIETGSDEAGVVARLLDLAGERIAAVVPVVSTAPWRRLAGLAWRHRELPWWVRPVPLAIDLLIGLALLVSVLLGASLGLVRVVAAGGRHLARTGATARRAAGLASQSASRAVTRAWRTVEKTVERNRKEARRFWREVRVETPRRFARLRKQAKKSGLAWLRRGVHVFRRHGGPDRPRQN
ncbi:MAG: hypothetical protein AB7I25_01750 [Vicinamibacterales bacterium]